MYNTLSSSPFLQPKIFATPSYHRYCRHWRCHLVNRHSINVCFLNMLENPRKPVGSVQREQTNFTEVDLGLYRSDICNQILLENIDPLSSLESSWSHLHNTTKCTFSDRFISNFRWICRDVLLKKTWFWRNWKIIMDKMLPIFGCNFNYMYRSLPSKG